MSHIPVCIHMKAAWERCDDCAKLGHGFVAAPNLIDELQRLRAENAALRADIERHVAIATELATENAKLNMETIPELRADALRHREVRRRFNAAKTSASERILEALGLEGDSLDVAVDSAMKEPAK